MVIDAGNSWRHRGQVRRAGHGDIRERVITPQTVPSNPRNGEPLTAVASSIICDSRLSAVSPHAFHRGIDGVHLGGRNFVRDPSRA